MSPDSHQLTESEERTLEDIRLIAQGGGGEVHEFHVVGLKSEMGRIRVGRDVMKLVT
jgi:hypothetical protein